jgi:hypothetical protein
LPPDGRGWFRTTDLSRGKEAGRARGRATGSPVPPSDTRARREVVRRGDAVGSGLIWLDPGSTAHPDVVDLRKGGLTRSRATSRSCATRAGRFRPSAASASPSKLRAREAPRDQAVAADPRPRSQRLAAPSYRQPPPSCSPLPSTLLHPVRQIAQTNVDVWRTGECRLGLSVPRWQSPRAQLCSTAFA